MASILKRLTIFVLLALPVAACSADPDASATSSVTLGASPSVRGDMGILVYRAVDQLVAGAPDVTADTPIIVASISGTENVEVSSPLGNIVSDLIRSRLVQDGRRASEIRLRRTISFNRGEGEFLLSRNPGALLRPNVAAAVVTGTYAASYDKVYVSLKLVSAGEGNIISAADFAVPLREVEGLLKHTTTTSGADETSGPRTVRRRSEREVPVPAVAVLTSPRL